MEMDDDADLRPPLLTLRRRLLLRRRRRRLAREAGPAASVASEGAASVASEGAAAARAGDPAWEEGIRRPSGGSSRSPPRERCLRRRWHCRRASTASALSFPTDSRRGTVSGGERRGGGLHGRPGAAVAGLGLVRLGRHGGNGGAPPAAAPFLMLADADDAGACFASAQGFSFPVTLASHERGEKEKALLPLLCLLPFSPSSPCTHRAAGAACCFRIPHLMARTLVVLASKLGGTDEGVWSAQCRD